MAVLVVVSVIKLIAFPVDMVVGFLGETVEAVEDELVEVFS